MSDMERLFKLMQDENAHEREMLPEDHDKRARRDALNAKRKFDLEQQQRYSTIGGMNAEERRLYEIDCHFGMGYRESMVEKGRMNMDGSQNVWHR